MASLPLSALAAAIAVGVALQVPYLLLRRSFPSLLDRLRFQLWIVALAGLTYHVVAVSATLDSTSFSVFAFLAAVLSVDVAYRTLDRFWLARLMDHRGRHMVPQLVRDLMFWVVLASAIVVAGTKILGWSLGTWALPSAVISAVLGFALQDVLKNVFAGLSLQTEAPFDLGDWLLVDNDPRQVIEMSWRSTHLRNNLGHNFREPNANLANRDIVNLGSGHDPMGFEVEVGVVYGAPPAEVKRSLELAAASSKLVVQDPAPVGLAVDFGESAVIYRLRFWSRDVHMVARVLDEVRTRVWYQLHRDGFTIPFPIRTVEFSQVADLRADRLTRDRERAMRLMAESDLFGPLPEPTRERLAAVARHLHFDTRERLVVEGQSGHSLLLIASGTVSVSKAGHEIGAGTVSLATLGAGNYFGEMSLLTGAPRSATVTANEPVDVFVLDRDAIAPILESDPALAETLSHVLAERTAATHARFEGRKEELARLVDSNRQTILSRIRGFFRLDPR